MHKRLKEFKPVIDILGRLRQITRVPPNSEEYDEWLTQKDIVNFLQNNAQEDEIVIYASLAHFFLHGILVPRTEVDPPDVDDILNWNFNPFDSWNVGANATIIPAFTHTGGRCYARAEQLLFARTFEGVTEVPTYIEISQRLAHVSGIHYMEERNAWSV